MKRIVLIFYILILFSCGGESSPSALSEEVKDMSTTEQQEEINPDAGEVVAEEEIGDEMIAEEKEKCETDFSAYVYDPGEEITNVRNAPGGDIVLRLSWEMDQEYMLWIDKYESGWFHLKGDIMGMESDLEIPGGQGWIHHSVIAIDTRNYGDQMIPIYERADINSNRVGEIPNERGGVRVKKACGAFVFIALEMGDGTVVEGWIEEKWACGC